MHWLGKTLAALVVIATIAGMWLTAELIEDRNSWARKVQSFSSDFEKNQSKLLETRKQTEQVRNELETATREWGGVGGTWTTDTRVNPADGHVQVGLGTNNRLKDKQLLHGFEVLPDGQSRYRGAFVITTAQAEASALSPTWRVRAEDAATWQSGKWRWRTNLPSAYADRSDDQAVSFNDAEETLNDRRAILQVQQRLIAEAQKQRQERVAEIVGGEQLAQDASLAPEFRLGLSSTLAGVEEERNKVLLEIDDLRRKVRQARDAVEQLQQANTQLVQKLPQPAAAVSQRD
jgi:hypothetical protein